MRDILDGIITILITALGAIVAAFGILLIALLSSLPYIIIAAGVLGAAYMLAGGAP